jgi:hypothetical protein
MRRLEASPPALAGERSARAAAAVRGPVAEFVSSALGLDPDAIQADLERMRQRHPGESDLELARRCVTNAAWHAAAVSLVLGLPDHPALAITGAAVEALAVRRIRLLALARIALLQETQMLQAGGDPVSPLRERAGRPAASHAAVALLTTAGKTVRKAAIRRVGKVDRAHLVRTLSKRVGLEACGRTILRLMPVVGAVAGAAATASALRREIERAFPHLATTGGLSGRVAGISSAPHRVTKGLARQAAVEIVAAGIWTCDRVVAATRSSGAAVTTLLVEARAAARTGGGCTRAAA